MKKGLRHQLIRRKQHPEQELRQKNSFQALIEELNGKYPPLDNDEEDDEVE